MPRPLRYTIPGVPQHVVQRGNNRQPTFFDAQDYRLYLECLREASERHQVAVHAYVLMTNHVHLLLTPGTADGIAKMFQSVGRRYVLWVNRTYRRSGTLWEGRHKASVIHADRYLLACQRYIELNPVRASMVAKPEDYPWSSYRWHAFGHPDPLVVDHPLYAGLSNDPESRQASYRALFSLDIDKTTLDCIRSSTERCSVLGNDRFRGEIEQVISRRVPNTQRGRPRKAVLQEKPERG